MEIDENIKGLVKTLNKFKGLRTIGSCGGHEDAEGCKWPADRWYVKFVIEQRNPKAWIGLEFLAWAINHDYRCSHDVILFPDAPPPYLNEPGKVLTFNLEGYNGEDPDDLAAFLNSLKREYRSCLKW